MKTYRGSGGIPPLILISALDGGELSTGHPCHSPPVRGERMTVPVGKKAGLFPEPVGMF
jgi:hypothetical protein